MKYLVLGSDGQIGHPLCDYLRRMGHEAMGFDIAANSEEDLRSNKDLLRQRMREADFVFFLAFDVGGSRYLKTYERTYEFISNNTKIMDLTFDALRELQKPFIFASSQMANMTHSSYGVLKALGDFYTRTLNGLVVKFWNVYGVEHDPEKFHAITDFIIKAKRQGRIELLTTGEETRQFLQTVVRRFTCWRSPYSTRVSRAMRTCTLPPSSGTQSSKWPVLLGKNSGPRLSRLPRWMRFSAFTRTSPTPASSNTGSQKFPWRRASRR